MDRTRYGVQPLPAPLCSTLEWTLPVSSIQMPSQKHVLTHCFVGLLLVIWGFELPRWPARQALYQLNPAPSCLVSLFKLT
jgi:hypothetical protein